MLTKIVTLLALVSTVYCVEFQIINNSSNSVFVQLLGTEYPEPFILQREEQKNLSYDEPWSGRIWGRVDCYSVDECTAAGNIPATLAELTIGFGYTFYDLSLSDGFNIELSMAPIDGIGDGSANSCQIAECTQPILDLCPEELKLLNSEGEVVSCQSGCTAFQNSEYCCRDVYPCDHPDTPPSPIDYSDWFKQKCPSAYCNDEDVGSSAFTCDTNKFAVAFL